MSLFGVISERDHIADNENFGKDRSRCFNNIESALKYFDELTNAIKLSQGMVKTITGVGQNNEVISEYQKVSPYTPGIKFGLIFRLIRLGLGNWGGELKKHNEQIV